MAESVKEENMEESAGYEHDEDAGETYYEEEAAANFVDGDDDVERTDNQTNDILEEEQEMEEMEEAGEKVGGTSMNGEEKKKEETKGNETQKSADAKSPGKRRKKRKNSVSETADNPDKRCFKCKHLGHLSAECKWNSEVAEDGYFKLSSKMLRHDSKQKTLRNAVHVAGVTMEDFPQLCSEMIADLLCCHLYLLAGEERKWFVEMVFTSKESAASALESIPSCYPEVEVEKRDFHVKAEADDDSVPQCLSDRYEFHPLIAKENPQPGEKYMLSVAGVSDEKFQELYGKVSHDILSLKFDSLPRTAETEKTGFLEVIFASGEVTDEAHDFVRSFDDKVEIAKHRLRPRRMAKKLKEKYELSSDLVETKRESSEPNKAKTGSSEPDKAQKSTPQLNKDKKGPAARGQIQDGMLGRLLYIAPMTVEDTLQLVERFKTDVLTWKMDLLPSHQNAMFVEMLFASHENVEEMSYYILCQYPEVDVEIPSKIVDFRQPGEKLRQQSRLDARIRHDGPVIALLSERSVDVDHEDLSPFWEEFPSATDIFAPRNDDGTFKRFVLLWLPDRTLCTKYFRQGVCEIGGIKYLTAEYFNPVSLKKLFEEMDKLMQNSNENEAESISKRLQRKLEIVNYYLHWAGNIEFDDADVETHKKNLKKYLGLGFSKVYWCKRMKKKHANKSNQQHQHPHKRFRDRSPATGGYGGKRSRSNDSWKSQYAGLNAVTGLPNANPMQMSMNPSMGNWQPQSLTRMTTGNMMTTMGMNTGFNRRDSGYFNSNPRQSYSERGYGADAFEFDRGMDMYGDAPSGRHYSDRSSDQYYRNRQQMDYYEAPRAGTSQGAGAFNDRDENSKKKAMKLLYGLTQLLK